MLERMATLRPPTGPHVEQFLKSNETKLTVCGAQFPNLLLQAIGDKQTRVQIIFSDGINTNTEALQINWYHSTGRLADCNKSRKAANELKWYRCDA